MTKQNKWLGPFHFNGSCITSQLLHLDIKLMLHFWDKSTTFKVYFSKKLVKKTKNWMNFQIKRYSITSRLLTDFPPSPSFLQPPKLLIQCVFIYAALFEVFIILQEMMNLLLKMIFKSSIISTFVSTGQLIFFCGIQNLIHLDIRMCIEI